MLHVQEDLSRLAADVKAEARAVGFDLCGITTADPFTEEGRALAQWVARNYHGTMAYMARNAPRSPFPRYVAPSACSLVVVGIYYGEANPEGHETDGEQGLSGPPRGRLSRYAWGQDYHRVMEPRLKRLAAFLLARGARLARFYVDTGPLIDRAAARRAGIGCSERTPLLLPPAGTDRGYSWGKSLPICLSPRTSQLAATAAGAGSSSMRPPPAPSSPPTQSTPDGASPTSRSNTAVPSPGRCAP